MMKEFEMTNLGLLTYYLSIEVDQRKDCIMLKQSTYAKNLLQQLKMAECNPTKYPMEAKLQLGKMLKEVWWIPLSIGASSEVWGTWLILVWTFHMVLEWWVGKEKVYYGASSSG